jgi:uncharacterized integral membrane protein
MPWRLIEFIILFALFLFFIVFNLENKCSISFGFRRIENAPVYLTAFTSFIFGMLCAMPFIISARARKKAKKTEGENSQTPKKPRGKKAGETENSFTGAGPYGIN